MLNNLNGWHLIVILAVILLLFGAPKLPGLARSIGQSMRIFKSEVKTMQNEDGAPADDTVKKDASTSSTTPPDSSTKS